MTAIRTLTLNPSIDVSSEADVVVAEKKVRTCCERIDPGGGGINVARVLHRFGAEVEAIFLAGGATGAAFDALLNRTSLRRRWVKIEDDTRTSLAVHERSTGEDYRFVPEGPTVSEAELAACRAAISESPCDWFVASGSLPPGVPDNFYADVGRSVRETGARFILDTSDAELRAALSSGGIHLLKASKEEIDRSSAAAIVASGQAELVALTLGAAGAMLIGDHGTHFLPTFQVETVSTVGAGDSFLAGMVFGLSEGRPPLEAFRLAVATGAAATLEAGTGLADPAKVKRLLNRVPDPRPLV